MTRFILTLEMTQPMDGAVLISCAIVGDPGNVRGLTRQIGTMLEAEPALAQAVTQTALSIALTR
jgi:hypothetical protein